MAQTARVYFDSDRNNVLPYFPEDESVVSGTTSGNISHSRNTSDVELNSSFDSSCRSNGKTPSKVSLRSFDTFSEATLPSPIYSQKSIRTDGSDFTSSPGLPMPPLLMRRRSAPPINRMTQKYSHSPVQITKSPLVTATPSSSSTAEPSSASTAAIPLAGTAAPLPIAAPASPPLAAAAQSLASATPPAAALPIAS
eukprot:227057_1